MKWYEQYSLTIGKVPRGAIKELLDKFRSAEEFNNYVISKAGEEYLLSGKKITIWDAAAKVLSLERNASQEISRNINQAETVESYRRLRVVQRGIHSETLARRKMLSLTGEIETNCSNAVDQIEQALEKIKAGTTDSIVLEILHEIDGEVRY